MKMRLPFIIAGSIIGLALPVFSQEQNTVEPEVRQHRGGLRHVAERLLQLDQHRRDVGFGLWVDPAEAKAAAEKAA